MNMLQFKNHTQSQFEDKQNHFKTQYPVDHQAKLNWKQKVRSRSEKDCIIFQSQKQFQHKSTLQNKHTITNDKTTLKLKTELKEKEQILSNLIQTLAYNQQRYQLEQKQLEEDYERQIQSLHCMLRQKIENNAVLRDTIMKIEKQSFIEDSILRDEDSNSSKHESLLL